MNIFFLEDHTRVNSEYHVDKHVTKMIIEYAQLLSTAHRLLDGIKGEHLVHCVGGEHPRGGAYGHVDRSQTAQYKYPLLDGEKLIDDRRKFYLEGREKIHYSSLEPSLRIWFPRVMLPTHASHPSAIWARETNANYNWLFEQYEMLNWEKMHRYRTSHLSYEKWHSALFNTPSNIPHGLCTPFPQAMPEKYKVPGDAKLAYRRYYVGDKYRFAKWKNRLIPEWYLRMLRSVWREDGLLDERVAYVKANPNKTDLTPEILEEYL